MHYRFIIMIVLSFLSISIHAQKERKQNREGVKSFYDNDYPNSEVSFRKALEIDSAFIPANFNLAASLYKQDKYDEARAILQKITETNTDQSIQAGAFHNIGNSFLKEEKYQEGIEAYKKSLLLQPNNPDTKYNLAYALMKLQEQQQQDQNKDQKDQNKDKQDQDKKDQDKDKDKEQQDNQNEDQKKEDQDQQQQQDEEQNGDKKDQQSPQLKNLSPEDVKNILEALQQQEKDVKEKVDKKKVKAVKSKSGKDW